MGYEIPGFQYSKIGWEKYNFSSFYQCEGLCAQIHIYMCSMGVEVGVPIVMLGAGEGSVKIAQNGISCKYSV